VKLVKVLIQTTDPLADMAISGHLAERPAFEVLSDEHERAADVIVLAAERLTVKVISRLRRIKNSTTAPVVLIAGEIGYEDLTVAVEYSVMAVLPRPAATGDRIEEAVLTAASGGGMLPQKMLGDLIRQLARIQREILAPQGLHTSGLTPREVDVLRMMSDGLTTTEIAKKLCLSERAVKRAIFGITDRLKLRNRPHAVAYALRAGVI
jgi:DNA-binding NarL/FixJ family response regulator